ncbi:MAG: hypothetical protein GX951_03235 [Mollicutes bacterium]|nr:hypothetical protein [Mollicutes bacterium]
MRNKSIFSALIGTVFFAVPYLTLSVEFFPSLLIGSAAFVAGELVLSKDKTKERKTNLPFYQVVDNAQDDNKQILEVSKHIEDENIIKALKSINQTTSRIINKVKKTPSKKKKIDNFFDYYLPVTVKIAKKYEEIENQKLTSADSKKFMDSAKKMIIEADEAFKKILSKIYQSDIIDADAEMKVFNTMLESDGINKNYILNKSKESEDE